MGDRWVENFVLRMQEKCSALQKCLKMEEICSALQISEKSFVYLQRNAFFIG